MQGYHVTANVGSTGRGTAIIHKLQIQFQRIECITSGRGIAAYLADTCIINIYAPSGTAKRTEGEEFFNVDVLGLLPLSPVQLIIAGDISCVLGNKDCTGQRTSSQALQRLINGLKRRRLGSEHKPIRVYSLHSNVSDTYRQDVPIGRPDTL